MRRQRRTTIIVVGGALAIASVGYGLGTQAGDGTAIADNATTEQDGSGADRGGAPPLPFERGEWWLASAYVVGSVVLSIGALVAALYLVRAAV